MTIDVPENAPEEQDFCFEYVYLIGCVENSLIKIGRSIDVPARLALIQRMSPVRLYVLWQAEGGVELESLLHRAFAGCRSHGEWFDFTGCDNPVQVVANIIDRLPDDPPNDRAEEEDLSLIGVGDMVRIAASNWPGPRTGIVHRECVERGRRVYYVGALDQYAAAYAFAADELRPLVIRGMPLPTRARRRKGHAGSEGAFNASLVVDCGRSMERRHHPGRMRQRLLSGY